MMLRVVCDVLWGQSGLFDPAVYKTKIHTHIYITHPAKIFGHLSDYEAIYIFFKQDVATGHTEKKFYALGTDILFTEY